MKIKITTYEIPTVMNTVKQPKYLNTRPRVKTMVSVLEETEINAWVYQT